MLSVIEVTPNTSLEGIIDASAKDIEKKAEDYLDLDISNVKRYHRYTIDAELEDKEVELVEDKIFKKNSRKTSLNKPIAERYCIDFDSATPPHPVFELIQEKGKVSTKEMYEDFNMGFGMYVIVTPKEVYKTLKTLKGYKVGDQEIKAEVIGKITNDHTDINIIAYDDSEITYPTT
ncbi:MAG: hypothetical protein JSW73_02220 [Candidatus Woesearchaeota archaeon]|nr:MAG: hypothetical protein JSW73_02220 [Candidatus Woesearchaeota archaeon]